MRTIHPTPSGFGAAVVLAVLAVLVPASAALAQAGAGAPEAADAPGAAADTLPAGQDPITFDWNVLDPRIGLEAGWQDAESAISNLEHVANLPRPEGFFNPERPVEGAGFSNTDLAFQGDRLFQGNYNGFLVYDISDPTEPTLEVEVVCPGGQGDVSVYRNLLFMSAQESRGRIDCGTQGVPDSVSVDRLQGLRVFDISDIRSPRQVAAVQTCRGSHTHTVVTDPDDDENVYVYVSGTGSVRPSEELPGCSALPPGEDPNTAYFRIEVVQVPLDAPEEARIVNMPRLFQDPVTGDIAGLWRGGAHGEGTQETRQTNQCHDITTFPEIGLAAGACSGNGILIDISDPVNPVRIDEVLDPNFAYWHSATFNNDGSKILFTDEWGGGSQARCRATDPADWGADAIFRVEDREMELVSYYKLPVPQTGTENCVAHNGSIIPVPGRDLMVQAWYQGGLSVFDFTDPENPREIAFFDRGPLSTEELHTGGYWSTYWYNGYIYGAEITRGLDVFRLVPSEHLSSNEIEAARLVRFEEVNAQHQQRFEWEPSPVVVASLLDQLERGDGIPPNLLRRAREAVDEARSASGGAAAGELNEVADALRSRARMVAAGDALGDPERLELTASEMRRLAETL